mmetsp:Transcript_39962/g.87250  ORF Transcript_39962/g.87250 Transcript_39962/m.87250 type:complete len:173 (-) Transcript_39962:86-604(-)
MLPLKFIPEPLMYQRITCFLGFFHELLRISGGNPGVRQRQFRYIGLVCFLTFFKEFLRISGSNQGIRQERIPENCIGLETTIRDEREAVLEEAMLASASIEPSRAQDSLQPPCGRIVRSIGIVRSSLINKVVRSLEQEHTVLLCTSSILTRCLPDVGRRLCCTDSKLKRNYE